MATIKRFNFDLKKEVDGRINFICEFTAKTMEQMENAGVYIDELAKKPMSFKKVFRYALLKNHKKITQNETNRIYDAYIKEIGSANSLVEALSVLITDAIQKFVGLTDEEDKEKKSPICWGE